MNKRKISKISISLAVVICLLGVLLTVLLGNNHPSEDIIYGDFSGQVVFSDNLNTILEEDFDKYTYNIIEEALIKKFSSLYTSGTGLEIANYNATNKNYSIRIIDSYGSFHTITVEEAEENVTIQVDDSKESYPIVIPEREESQETLLE